MRLGREDFGKFAASVAYGLVEAVDYDKIAMPAPAAVDAKAQRLDKQEGEQRRRRHARQFARGIPPPHPIE